MSDAELEVTEVVEEVIVTEEPDYSGLSDDEFLEQEFSSNIPAVEPDPVVGDAAPTAVESEEVEAVVDPTAEEADPAQVTDSPVLEVAETSPDELVDFEAKYNELIAPFKANGKEMTVSNIEDARQLMQMGAGYNKKMASLRPALKTLKMLENNDLVDPDKLSFLIDLNKKDPAAIAKFLKDSGINPMDLDLDNGDTYAAKDRTVSDAELAMDSVLADIKGSDTYDKTLNIVTAQWDDGSKQMISGNPEILKVLDSHVANGVYDTISNEMERERALGRLNGLSDIEAYRKVGDAIEARGGFAAPEDTPAAAPKVVIQPSAQKSTTASSRQDKRTAATASKKAASQPASQLKNPWSMSDDEFEKQFDAKFL